MKVKKSLIIFMTSLCILCIVFCASISMATDNAKIKLTVDKTEVVAGENVKVTVKVKDITGILNGILGIQGKITYDNAVFESVSFASLNDWDKPEYNESNGSFLTAKGDYVKNDEDVFIMSLKVKNNAKLGETKIQLTDMQVADLDSEYSASGDEIKVKIVEKSLISNDNDNTKDDKNNTVDNTIKNDTVNNNQNKNIVGNITENTNNSGNLQKNNTSIKSNSTIAKVDNITSKGVLPKTGVNGNVLIVAGVIFILIGTFSYIKYQEYKKIK